MITRPLGRLSDFVAVQLPFALRSPQSLVKHVEGLVAGIGDDWIAKVMVSAQADLAFLDLTMLEYAIAHSGHRSPKALTDLVDRFAKFLGCIPALLYEPLILVNPSNDLRCFTCGLVGRSEASFYRMQYAIEQHLGSAVSKTRSSIEAIRHGSYDDALECLDGIACDLKKAIALTEEQGGLPVDDFNDFRRFWMTHPTRKLPGPSGAHSANFHILETLLRFGEGVKWGVPDSFERETMSYVDHLPRRSMPLLREALELGRRHESLLGLWLRSGQDERLRDHIAVIGQFFNDFRRKHLTATMRQLQDAVDDKAPGTSVAENPGTYLRRKMSQRRFPVEMLSREYACAMA